MCDDSLLMMMMMMFQASSEISSVFSFLRAARAGSDQQIVECLDAGVDINVCNPVSTEELPIGR